MATNQQIKTLDLKQSYFSLFGLKADFVVDHQLLQMQQKKLQAEFHPDRYVQAGAAQRRLSVQQSSWINEAYQTLADPVKRAFYLLELNGFEHNHEATTTADTAFLIEQIELREQLDECRNHPEPLIACERINSILQLRAKQLAEEFASDYHSKALDRALMVCQKMQFIHRIQEQLSVLQCELENEDY